MKLAKFIPNYQGQKSYYVPFLEKYKGENFIEPFCGAAVISANLARTSILNDIDPYIYQIISQFNQLEVPEIFTQEDYFRVRKQDDWWKYIYCLSKLSFSGGFRYSKNGFNVSVKKYIPQICAREEYLYSLEKISGIELTVLNKNYLDLELVLFKDRIVVMDPPYLGGKALYNNFSYGGYWEFIDKIIPLAKTTLIFDFVENLESKNLQIHLTKKLRVYSKNGKTSTEGLAIIGENRL